MGRKVLKEKDGLKGMDDLTQGGQDKLLYQLSSCRSSADAR